MAATDHYTRIHQVLKLSHDVLRRGAHQMGEYAPKVSNDEAPAFVGYSLAFLSNLLSHHDMEEQVLFPAVTSKIPGVSTRHDEHVKLAELMGAFKAYLEGVQSGSEQWSAEKYMSLFTSVKDLVLPHVTAEESDLTPEVLKTALNDAEAEVLVRDLAAAGKGSGERTLNFAFLLKHLSPEETTIFFNRVPFVIRDYVFPLYTWWNASYWKYATTAKL